MSAMIYWTVSREDQLSCFRASLPFEQYLTPDEIDRLGYLRFPKRRAEWLQGRWTIKYLLRHSHPPFADLSPRSVQVKNEPEGMPYFEDVNSLNPLAVNISISHRDHYAFCALTPNVDLKIGADIELIESRPPSFLEDFFTPAEYQQGVVYHGRQRDLWFTLVWSLKESMLKALGKGLRLDTRCVEIRDIGDNLPVKACEVNNWQIAHLVYEGEPETLWCAWWRKQDRFVYTMAARLPMGADCPQLQEVSACLEE